MVYLSKGVLCESYKENWLSVVYCGRKYKLTGSDAEFWLNGQIQIAHCLEQKPADSLQKLGLVEWEKEDSALSRYRILSRCICCPAKSSHSIYTFGTLEKELLIWLTQAGLRLSTAELVYLVERKMKPEKRLLHECGRQALVEAIYTSRNIADNVLEMQMERSPCRDMVVDSLLKLLKMKKLVIL